MRYGEINCYNSSNRILIQSYLSENEIEVSGTIRVLAGS